MILDATATDGLGFHEDPKCIASSWSSNGTRQHRNRASATLTRGPIRKREFNRCLDDIWKGLLIVALELVVIKPSVPDHYDLLTQEKLFPSPLSQNCLPRRSALPYLSRPSPFQIRVERGSSLLRHTYCTKNIWLASTPEDNISPRGVEPDDSRNLGYQESTAARQQTSKAKGGSGAMAKTCLIGFTKPSMFQMHCPVVADLPPYLSAVQSYLSLSYPENTGNFLAQVV